MNLDFSKDIVENFETKQLICFVIEASSEMVGDKIHQINEGLKEFLNEIKNDEFSSNRFEPAIITFNSDVSLICKPRLLDDTFELTNIYAEGSNKLVKGINNAIDLVEKRKNWYKRTGQPYLRPWIILLLYSKPDFDQSIEYMSSKVKVLIDENKFSFYPISLDNEITKFMKKAFPYDKNCVTDININLRLIELLRYVKGSTAIAISKPINEINLPNLSDWMNE